MTQTATVKTPVMFAPRLRAADEWANYWLRQVMLRLRREVCWLLQERGLTPPGYAATLPPFIDKTNETLDLARFHDAKQQFWTRDVTAVYLTAELAANQPPTLKNPLRGTFGWLMSWYRT